MQNNTGKIVYNHFNYSIENDIRKIRRFLEKWPELELIRTPNHLRLGGGEKSRRKLYRYLLTRETEGNFLNLNKLASLYGRFDLLEVKDILDDVFRTYGYSVREITLPMLMLHIGVSVERILDNNYVDMEVGYEVSQDRKEYMIAACFFERISKRFHVPVIRDEVVLLTLFLMERSGSRQEMEDSDFTWLLEDILGSIYQKFDVDFRKDPELKRGLGIHIRYMLDRIIQAGCISNVCLEEIKGRYPLVFEMGCHVSDIIEDRMQLSVNENEIGFIALHLGCAYERLKDGEKYRAVIICPYNHGLLTFCADKMTQLFGSRMEIAETMTLFEASAVTAAGPDFLITTFPLKHELEIPTVQISLLMNQEDESRIFQVLNVLDNQRFRNRNLPRIISLIRPEFFYTRQEVENPQEAIRFLCGRLFQNGYLPDTFTDSVLSREMLSSTSFAHGFAIPHSLNIPSRKSAFSVMLLKKPVRWGEYDDKPKEEIIKEFSAFVSKSHELGYEVAADTNPRVFVHLGASPLDLRVFAEMGVDIIRLDGNFGDYEDRMITRNPYGIKIEFNGSCDVELDNLIRHGAAPHNIIICHNFYPEPYSGLGWRTFMDFNRKWKSLGLHTAAFVSSSNENTYGPWPVYAGLPTVELDRGLPVELQVRHLLACELIDDILIGNAYASEEELKAMSNIVLTHTTIRLEAADGLSDTEKSVIWGRRHAGRTDASDYYIRSCGVRPEYCKNRTSVPARHCDQPMFRRGDVVMINDNLAHYRGELEIILKDIPNDGERNFVGRIPEQEYIILDLIEEKRDHFFEFIL